MTYSGNTALSPQIQERILNTFRQTLSLAEEGNLQEALLGCDFILRLDPLFEPARQLQERLREGDGLVDLEQFLDLDSPAEPQPAETAPGEADPGETTDDEALIEIESPIAEPTEDDLPARLAMLLEQRHLQQALELAQQHGDRVTADPEIQQLVQIAASRLDAEPYVKNFLDSARAARDQGDLDRAGAQLEKARELDPSHPEISVLEADLRATTEPEIEAAAEVTPAASAAFETEEPADGELVDLGAEPLLDAEPAARLDSESEQRIDELLQEGQESFESGEYQSAVDAWSRIFLIDIDHAEASRRIELARKLKAEVERQIEESFHEGISLLESGEVDTARETFEKVLEMQAGHLGAREYLDKLDSGDLTASDAEAQELAPVEEPPPPQADLEGADLLEKMGLETEAVAEPTLAPEPAPPPPLAPEPQIPPRKRSFGLIGGAVLVVLLLVAWFVYSKWDSIFPASTTPQTTQVQPRVDPIVRARELHEAGNTAMAINVLRRLPPGHDQFAEAQSLIAMWETGDQPEEIPSGGPSDRDLARRENLVGQARSAFQQGENLLSLELLDRAAKIAELRGDERELRILVTDMLEDLERELELFEQGDWEYALPNLWRLHESDPQNRDVLRLMVDSYYNLGLRDLQRGAPKEALEKFQEALELSPDDPDAQRLAEFAAAYDARPSDLLYRIFVKYQQFR